MVGSLLAALLGFIVQHPNEFGKRHVVAARQQAERVELGVSLASVESVKGSLRHTALPGGSVNAAVFLRQAFDEFRNVHGSMTLAGALPLVKEPVPA